MLFSLLRNMDGYISSFLESDQTDEFVNFFAVPSQEQQIVPQAEEAKYIQKRKCNESTAKHHQNPQKKINHREIERQRRQEMAVLYRSLRSILPIEYLKGKRSISDHIQEAAKYIKDLEKKIQELNRKRNEMNKSSGDNQMLETKEENDELTVKPCLFGVEVVVDTSLKNCLPLSKVLQILIQENLSIVSCNSAKVKERLLHTIKSEAIDGKSIDVSALEEKLTNSIIRPVN